MTNEVFAALFQADGKALRAWDPARGCTLESFVGLLARHQALSILRSGKASPWPDEPTDDEQLETLCRTSMSAEEIVSSREHLHLLLDRVRQELSPIDQELFQCLIVEDQPVDQVAARFKKNVPAIYQWRHRLLENLRKWSAEILENVKSREALDRDTNRRREKGGQ